MRMDALTRDLLDEAARLYVDEAYAGAALPEAVRARLQWPRAEALVDLLAGEPFERDPEGPPNAWQRVRLRLGGARYPHMKLGLDRVPETDQWVLVVDTHDGLLAEAAGPGERDAVEALVRGNAELKGRIERRWTEAGLPTFSRYVRDHLSERTRARADAAGPTDETP